MVYTILGIVETSLFLYVTEHIEYHVNSDTLLAALFAGVFVGIGLGCMFKAGGTSGGIGNFSPVSKSIFRLERR